jgi:hypothetical protein
MVFRKSGTWSSTIVFLPPVWYGGNNDVVLLFVLPMYFFPFQSFIFPAVLTGAFILYPLSRNEMIDEVGLDVIYFYVTFEVLL